MKVLAAETPSRGHSHAPRQRGQTCARSLSKFEKKNGKRPFIFSSKRPVTLPSASACGLVIGLFTNTYNVKSSGACKQFSNKECVYTGRPTERTAWKFFLHFPLSFSTSLLSCCPGTFEFRFSCVVFCLSRAFFVGCVLIDWVGCVWIWVVLRGS